MQRLVVDLVRRTYRWPTAMFLVGVAVLWSDWVDASQAQTAFAASLAAAFTIGPLFVAGTPTPRVIWYLPISSRELWRAKWLVATVAPVMLTTTAKLIALPFLGTRSSLGLSTLALSSLYDFAYAGIGFGLSASSARSVPPRGLRRRLYLVFTTTRLVAFVGAPFWAFAIRHSLPTQWTGLSPLSGAVLAVALAWSCATYFRTPVPVSHSGGVPARPRSNLVAPRGGLFSGLTGLPHLIWHEYAWSIALGGFLALTFGALVFVTAALTNSLDLHGGFLRTQSLLLFDRAVTPPRRQLFDLAIWCGLFWTTLLGRFPEILRHLRVLPLRASQLNLLFVAWPLVMLLTIWLVLLGLHYAVLGPRVESLRAALFVALAGSSALMRALSLRWPGYSPFIFSLTISVVPMVRLFSGPSPAFVGILGLGGIAAAAVFNHFTLLRGSTYKQAAQPFGVAAAQRWS